MRRGLCVFSFFSAVTAGHFTETFGIRIFPGVDRRRNGSFGCHDRAMLAGFDARATLLNQDLRLLQIFVGVNVSFFFLLRGFAGFFLAGGLGNLLVILLSAARRG